MGKKAKLASCLGLLWNHSGPPRRLAAKRLLCFTRLRHYLQTGEAGLIQPESQRFDEKDS